MLEFARKIARNEPVNATIDPTETGQAPAAEWGRAAEAARFEVDRADMDAPRNGPFGRTTVGTMLSFRRRISTCTGGIWDAPSTTMRGCRWMPVTWIDGFLRQISSAPDVSRETSTAVVPARAIDVPLVAPHDPDRAKAHRGVAANGGFVVGRVVDHEPMVFPDSAPDAAPASPPRPVPRRAYTATSTTMSIDACR